MRKSTNKLNVGITMGDACGIGPEILLKALHKPSVSRLANFVIIGNMYAIKKTAQLLKIELKISRVIQDVAELEVEKGSSSSIVLLDVGKKSNLNFGQEDISWAKIAMECIRTASRLIKAKKIDVLVTSPVNKHGITRAGYSFSGHTEYLAQASRTKNFAMMLVGGGLRVTLATRHVAIKDVARVLTAESVYQAIRLSAFALKHYFAVSHPRIGVCGLNPHSGDAGVFGKEENTIIKPAIKRLKHLVRIEGPLPADTLFHAAFCDKFDAVVAMYHDQGLVALKMLAFHQGVNLTLGLPFLRTSPDHGTAYNIAGKNMANPGSMIAAIKLAVKIGSRIVKD